MAEATYPEQYRYHRIVRAKRYVDRHFAEDLDLARIADEACYSKYHFTRLFKRIYGRTPHQYLTAVRIEKARQFLKDGRSVTAVCLAVGFESVGSFTELFKREVGEPPSVFRERVLEERAKRQRTPLAAVPHCFAAARGWAEPAGDEDPPLETEAPEGNRAAGAGDENRKIEEATPRGVA